MKHDRGAPALVCVAIISFLIFGALVLVLGSDVGRQRPRVRLLLPGRRSSVKTH